MNKQAKTEESKDMLEKNKNTCMAQISPRTVIEYLRERYRSEIKKEPTD